MREERLKTVLRYPGSKYRLAPWIASHFPEHRVYCEPFCGSLSVLLSKPRSAVEVMNDADGRVVNLFRVLRDDHEALSAKIALTPFAKGEFRAAKERSEDPVEDARRVLVRCWQSVGSIYDSQTGWKLDTRASRCPSLLWADLPERLAAVVGRLQGVQFDCCEADSLLERLDTEDVLHYVDPPYPASTRRSSLYSVEMHADSEHTVLLDRLCRHRGPVLLSSYPNVLYEERLAGWEAVSAVGTSMVGEAREEVLWLNPVAQNRLRRAQAVLPGLPNLQRRNLLSKRENRGL